MRLTLRAGWLVYFEVSAGPIKLCSGNRGYDTIYIFFCVWPLFKGFCSVLYNMMLTILMLSFLYFLSPSFSFSQD